MHLTDKLVRTGRAISFIELPCQWLHAVVGVNTGLTNADCTTGMREWAKENNVDYFEVTIDDGPSVDEMLTELIRKARLLPERVRSVASTVRMLKLRAD